MNNAVDTDTRLEASVIPENELQALDAYWRALSLIHI